MQFHVTIRSKIAVYMGIDPYICGNSDFVIHFDMDEEWAAHETKTARFVKQDGTYQDQVFTGNICPVPVISNTWGIMVGVFAGNLHTTTSAYIPAKKSILCGSGLPADPAPDVYAQLMERINELAKGGASEADIATAIEKYMQEHPVQMEESDPSVHAWAKQPEKPTYTAEEVGAQPKGNYALKSEIPAPYTLPVASADTLGGVKVGKGLRMDEDALGVEPEGEYEPIKTVTLEAEVASVTIGVSGYKKVKLHIEVPQADDTRTAVIGANSAAFAYYPTMTNGRTNRQYAIEFVKRNGRIFVENCGGGQGGGSGLLNGTELFMYPRAVIGYGEKNIYNVIANMLAGAVFPVGSIFTLEGVRENA